MSAGSLPYFRVMGFGRHLQTKVGESLADGLRGAMERLDERERFVLAMRFGIERERSHTLAEVARELGVSLERVRQIQMRAIAKLDTPALRRAVAPFMS